MGSGYIYAVIVGLWALVLIPVWLRSHDRTGEVRQIDKYRAAMTSLSGREYRSSGGSKPSAQHPRETAVRNTHDSDVMDEWHEPTAAELAATRRRLVMAVLAGLMAGAIILALLDVLPLWFLLLPAALLGGFGLISRQQALAAESRERREHERHASHQAQRERELASAPQQQRRYATTSTVRPADTSSELPEVRRAVHPTEAQLAREVDRGWEATNAPLPTYVSAPRASRIPRVIDLTHTGDWGGEAMVEEARRVQAADTFSKDAVFDQFSAGIDDDAFFDQLAAETHGRRSADFFDQSAPRAVND